MISPEDIQRQSQTLILINEPRVGGWLHLIAAIRIINEGL